MDICGFSYEFYTDLFKMNWASFWCLVCTMLPLELRIIWILFLTKLTDSVVGQCQPCLPEYSSPHVQSATFPSDRSPVLTHGYTCTGHAVLATRLTYTRDQLLSVPPATLDPSAFPSIRVLGTGYRLPRVRSHRGSRGKQREICVTDGIAKLTPMLMTLTPQLVPGDQPDCHHSAPHDSSLTSDQPDGHHSAPHDSSLTSGQPDCHHSAPHDSSLTSDQPDGHHSAPHDSSLTSDQPGGHHSIPHRSPLNRVQPAKEPHHSLVSSQQAVDNPSTPRRSMNCSDNPFAGLQSSIFDPWHRRNHSNLVS